MTPDVTPDGTPGGVTPAGASPGNAAECVRRTAQERCSASPLGAMREDECDEAGNAEEEEDAAAWSELPSGRDASCPKAPEQLPAAESVAASVAESATEPRWRVRLGASEAVMPRWPARSGRSGRLRAMARANEASAVAEGVAECVAAWAAASTCEESEGGGRVDDEAALNAGVWVG